MENANRRYRALASTPRSIDVPLARPVSERDRYKSMLRQSFDTHLEFLPFVALLNLHRGYFAQALQEMPADLHRHRYLPSVVAVYRSAWRLIHGLAMTWVVIPKFLARVNLAWSHGLSAAVSTRLGRNTKLETDIFSLLVRL